MKHLVALLAAFLLTGLSFSATAQAQGAGSTQREVRVDVSGPSRAGLVDPTCKAAALAEANRQLAHAADVKGSR